MEPVLEDVVVVGGINTDDLIRNRRLPAPGMSLSGGVFLGAPGGKGANAAVAAARLGAQTAIIGRVGHDARGTALLPSHDRRDRATAPEPPSQANRAIIDDELRHAERHQLSYTAPSWRASYGRSITIAKRRRSPGASNRPGLPETWTIESFPFKRQPGVNPKLIRTLAELECVAKAENIVLLGHTGVGKTGIASGLLLKAHDHT